MAASPPSTAVRIRRAARRLLAAQGAAGVTMRRVARAVGITPMAIYHHFPSREALLGAVADEEFGRFATRLQAAGGPEGDLLENALVAYLDYALQQPRLFDFVFGQKRKGARQFPADFRRRRSPTLTLLADAVRRRMTAGRYRRDDAWETALAFWALIHGLAVLQRGGRIALPAEEFRALCVRSIRRLIHGLEK